MSKIVNRLSNSAPDKKELFYATLVHDLKNPVHAQILGLKLLADGNFGKLNIKQKEMLDIIIESSNYMNNMLQSSLGSYKADNGGIYLIKKDFSPVKLVQNCIDEVKSFADNKNINIILKIKTPDIRLFADEIQLRRVISNLLNNSLNYSFEGSNLNISILSDKINMKFIIENTGNEISEEIKEHIFEKHISGSNIGTGLGLYFSKKIIEAHNGKIYVDCKGTLNKFIFEIPLNSSDKAFVEF